MTLGTTKGGGSVDGGIVMMVGAVWVLCAVLSAHIASSKGLPADLYFLIGLIFGVFGLLIAAAATPASAQSETNSQAPTALERTDRAESRQRAIATNIVLGLLFAGTVVLFVWGLVTG